MSPAPRVTQRAPQSCYPCAKRKMRCSKVFPCANCVRRKIPDQCVREAVILSRDLSKEYSSPIPRQENDHVNSGSNPENERPLTQYDETVDSGLHTDWGHSLQTRTLESDTTEWNDTHHDMTAECRRLTWNHSSRQTIATSSNTARNYETPPSGQSAEESGTFPLAIFPNSVTSPVATIGTIRGSSHDASTPLTNPTRSSKSRRQGPGSEGQLTMEAANTLESIAWGSHKATVEVYHGRNRALNIRGSLSSAQEKEVLDFHEAHVAWTHNVLHMPTFVSECQKYRQDQQQSLPSIGWLSLYYAVLSLSFMYMPKARADKIGLPETYLLAQSFYDLAIESLHAAELATINSIYFIQAICVILPCCHSYGDPKRIMILLSMANATAQIMSLHRMESNPTEPASVTDIISREIQKRVWCFLCIQDSYLITFKQSYSIVMSHCTTPPPANCDESEAGISSEGFVTERACSEFTQSTYQLLQRQMTNIFRNMFENVSILERAGHDICDIFDKVLEADASLIRVAQEMPDWLRPQTGPYRPTQSLQDADTQQVVMDNTRRTLRISFCHLRMSIHRNFFCRGITDKRFHYSYSTCLDAARIILREYQLSTGMFEVDCWTIPAHVLSACKIIMLKTVFNRLMIDVVGDEALQSVQDQNLMQTCLSMIRDLRYTNKIVERGLIMINRLMESQNDFSPSYTVLDANEMTRLVGEVEARIRADSGILELETMDVDENIFRVLDIHYSI